MTFFLLLVGVVSGAIVGFAFFAGLWWTTQRLVVSSRPGLLLMTSLLARFAVLAMCLLGLALLDASALVGALVGIVVMRMVVTRAATHSRFPVFTPTPGTSNERA